MLDWLVPSAWAGAGSPGGSSGWGAFLLPLLLLVIFYYFLIHLPQRRRQQERKRMLDNLKRGDEVVTSSGIYGRITGIADQTVTLEIAPKVRIKLAKSAISAVVSRAEGNKKE